MWKTTPGSLFWCFCFSMTRNRPVLVGSWIWPVLSRCKPASLCSSSSFNTMRRCWRWKEARPGQLILLSLGGFADYKKAADHSCADSLSVICVLWAQNLWSAYCLLPYLLCRDGDVPAPEHKGNVSLLSLLQPITHTLFKFLFHLSCSFCSSIYLLSIQISTLIA